MTPDPIFLRIGTRGSQLALAQATACASLLERAGARCDIVVIRTSGDRLADAPLSEVGGKRLFVKEIEDALLAGAVDLAVHSSKDMPAALPDGLSIAAALPREDPRDALVLPQTRGEPGSLDALVESLGPTPRIGTSSVRRAALLAALLPHARFLPIRGNLDTRLRKLDAGEFDAIVLAAAGLKRLDQAHRISMTIPVERSIPAPGQGIIAIEVRAEDRRTADLVRRIDDAAASTALEAERAVVARLGGGCQMPIGAYAKVANGRVAVTAAVVSLDGSRAVRARAEGPAADPAAVGRTAADRLIADGAADILADVRRAQGAVQGLQP